MATCNDKQNEAIQKILKQVKGKAYIVIFDLLNEEELTAFYQVRYNNRGSLAMDFKQWDVKENTHDAIRANVKEFVHNVLDQLWTDLGEDEVVIKRISIMFDGAICD